MESGDFVFTIVPSELGATGGELALVARATDRRGNQGETGALRLDVDASAPTVAFVAPDDGALLTEMGLVTVISGFVLWGISSPTLRKWTRKLPAPVKS